jgi:ribonucleotide reductase beta subunit family protein with ferritin-like domain
MTTNIVEEPLLLEPVNKYNIYPPPQEFMPIWNAYLKSNAAVWFQNEVDLSSDMEGWVKLTKDEQYFIKHILAFFAQADSIVLENLSENFMNEVKNIYAQMFYRSQSFMEDIHAITYGMLLEKYVTDPVELDHLRNSITTIPSIKKKADWAFKWMNSDKSFATRLVAFACMEGLFFYGSFASIFWIREKKLLPGLCDSNEFIERDERMHKDFAILLYTQYIVNKLDDETIHDIIRDAVDIECEFICNAIPARLVGINTDDMRLYIESIADTLCRDLGHSSIYPKSRNPFEFIKRRNFESKGNFFERRITNYKKVFKTDNPADDIKTLSFMEEF